MRRYPYVLGVIAMILGGISTLGAAIGLFIQAMWGAKNPLLDLMKSMPHARRGPDPTQMIDQMQTLMVELQPWLQGFTAARLLLSIALLVIGYGLIKRTARARRMAIYWSALGLVMVTAFLLFQLLVLQPKMAPITDAFMAQAGPGASIARNIQSTSQTIGVFIGALFSAAFPVILLAFLTRSSAKNDFTEA